MERREFTKKMMQTAAAVLFVESLFGCSAPADNQVSETGKVLAPMLARELRHWAVRLNEYCSDLGKGNLTLTEWQDRLAELFESVELDEVLRFIDFERMTVGFQLPDLGVATKKSVFPGIEGLPEKTIFVKKIFGMKPGRAIIPHGHSNMASGHLILEGDFRLRQYDKIAHQDGVLTIRPTVDKEISGGDFSSISDERNNIHWFVAGKKPAYTFDVIMLDIDGNKYDIHNIDIDSAEKLEGGDLKVPIMGVEQALSKYGKVVQSG